MDACRLYRLGTLKIEGKRNMESLAYENATPVDVGPPPLRGDVVLLGRRYNLPQEKGELMKDVQSRLWFTYRRNFKPISGTNITCDQGWGCTLRCGQMVMGNALLFKHLGREWRWSPDAPINASYMKILRMFLDKRDSEYSLHMIAHQGADFGRPIGQWFGPNNVAQALKKLSTHDVWSELAVHVALDMVVVVNDIKELCRRPHQRSHHVRVELADWEKRRSHTVPDISLTSSLPNDGRPSLETATESGAPHSEDLQRRRRVEAAKEHKLRFPHTVTGAREIERPKGGGSKGLMTENSGGNKGLTNGVTDGPKTSRFKNFPGRRRRQKKINQESFVGSAEFAHLESKHYNSTSSSSESDSDDDKEEGGVATGSRFRSILLFIPLRLGQDKFNMEYKEAVKACLSLPQSVGIIGGKPRHALYFIGHHGDNLLYLDPHTTQSVVSYSEASNGMVPDQSYHCSQPDRMHISDLDPSVALAFFCRDEADFDNLCHRLRERVLSKMQYMFELTEKRPAYWGPMERNPLYSIHEPFLLVNEAPPSPSPQYTFEEDSDGFEVIDMVHQ